MTAIRFLVPGNVLHRSGGNIYNERLVEHLLKAGATVTVEEVDGDWPVGSPQDRRRLGAAVAAADSDVVVVDGFIASGAPQEIEETAGSGRRVWILVHMALDDHPELEKRALRAATGVICTSSTACRNLEIRHGLENAFVVLPGVDMVEPVQGSVLTDQAGNVPHLVVVAAFLYNKAQDLVVESLARLKDLPWTASLVGSTTADPEYAARVQAAIDSLGLRGRVQVTGELAGEELEEQWRRADLSLLVSRVESFGMVVPESLAHGIPVLVRAGTGAVEALGATGAGAAVELDEKDNKAAEQLEAVLRTWLTDPSLRSSWHKAAIEARKNLPTWEDAAAKVLHILAENP